MTRVVYDVGANGYYTRCNTLESAKAQADGTDYQIIKVYEEVKEPLQTFGNGIKGTSRSQYEREVR